MDIQQTAISSGTGAWIPLSDPVSFSDVISGDSNNDESAIMPGILLSNFNNPLLVANAAHAEMTRNVTENTISSDANPPIRKTRPKASSLYR